MAPPGGPDADHKHEYHIRQLNTRSVTLFPSRAQVVREIKDIPLKVGINQIIFVGLTPSIDQHSVKIEGVGTAIISDTTVELLPNCETFHDVYPEFDSDNSDASPDEEEEDDSDDDDDDEQIRYLQKELRNVQAEIEDLRTKKEYATELTKSADSCLELLDSYGQSLTETRATNAEVDIAGTIAIYKYERGGLFENSMTGKERIREVQKKMSELTKEEARFLGLIRKESDKARKARMKAAKAKGKKKEERQRKKRDQAKEKTRIRKERESFWPKKVYVVKVNLEVRGTTPTSSRRSSVSSHNGMPKTSSEDPAATSSDSQTIPCDLTISYVTAFAYWSPSYDLALSTTANTGSLCFDAHLTNQTSETWNNCKIILSTSQTNFSSLNEVVPSLVPWRVGLASGGGSNHGDIAYSPEERARRNKLVSTSAVGGSEPQRHLMFGIDVSLPPRDSSFAYRARATSAQTTRGQSILGVLHGETGRGVPTLPEPQPNLITFQESSFEESGLTATYDLPGLKCLPPSSTISKQRVARVSFTEVVFSYTVVAKHNPAAYLQAKLRNTGKLTLLKGPVGLNLDGGFLGRSSLPRCAPGSSFKLSLGVDPAIQIAYTKPEIQRGQLGVFSKDNSAVYTRTLILHNARSGPKSKAVRLTAFDQVPISGDERLHIVILQPKGLAVGGSNVSAGEPEAGSTSNAPWGKAEAKMMDGGHVVWDVTVNAGCTAKLILQYQCVYPTGESTVNV
ncbi:threonyl-tRNA synthetase [Hypoxylon texense]